MTELLNVLRVAPGLPPPPMQTPALDPDDLEDLMDMWLERERAIFGHGNPEDVNENVQDNALRSVSVAWLSYVLQKHDAAHLLPKSITLLDALSVISLWPTGIQDGPWWVESEGRCEFGRVPARTPPPKVLVTLIALAQLTMKHEFSLPLRNDSHQSFWGPALIASILDASGQQDQPTTMRALMDQVGQEEVQLFKALEGRTLFTTPLEWASAVMQRLGCLASCNVSIPLAEHWAMDMLNKIPASRLHPPRAIGLSACALALVSSGAMEPLPSWGLQLQQIAPPCFANISVPTDLLASAAGCTMNQMRSWVLEVTTAYLTATTCVGPMSMSGLARNSPSPLEAHCGGSNSTTVSISSAMPPSEASSQSTDESTSTQQTRAPKNVMSYLEKGNDMTLLVSYFPRAALAEDLRRAFSEFDVTGAHIMLDSHAVSRCYGFMRFRDHECAQQAFDACARKSLTLDDARGKTWAMSANWAKKSIPEEGTAEAEAMQKKQEIVSASRSRTSRRSQRRPPTGLSMHK